MKEEIYHGTKVRQQSNTHNNTSCRSTGLQPPKFCSAHVCTKSSWMPSMWCIFGSDHCLLQLTRICSEEADMTHLQSRVFFAPGFLGYCPFCGQSYHPSSEQNSHHSCTSQGWHQGRAARQPSQLACQSTAYKSLDLRIRTLPKELERGLLCMVQPLHSLQAIVFQILYRHLVFQTCHRLPPKAYKAGATTRLGRLWATKSGDQTLSKVKLP